MIVGKPTILVLLGCFSTGLDATGPNQSMIGMARALLGRFRFRVIAEAVPDGRAGQWGKWCGVEQMPLRKSAFGAVGLLGIIRRTPHDILIANGFFDRQFTIPALLARRVGAIPRRPFLLAPRGEFSPGAFGIGRIRKGAYLAAVRLLRLLDGVDIQATTPAEAEEIRAKLRFRGKIYVTPNIRLLPPLPPHRPRLDGERLRIAFLSRIDRKKNLQFALEVAHDANLPMEFNLFGPISDQHYWSQCQKLIGEMPPLVKVTYHGSIGQDLVVPTLADHDLFFLPTLGENFGHAIVDALVAGTPVLIGDQTPWRDLETHGAGWDLPVSDKPLFVAALRDFHQMTGAETQRMRSSARHYIERNLDPQGDAAALAACFRAIINDATLPAAAGAGRDQ